MPIGDNTPAGCPRANFPGRMSVNPLGTQSSLLRQPKQLVGHRLLLSRSLNSIKDSKLQQHPFIQLPKKEEEELKSISSKGSTWLPRVSTPKQGVSSKVAKAESMELDPPATQATSRASSASMVAHLATQGGSATQAPSASAGSHPRQGQKMRKCATSQQGVHDIVAGVLVGQGISQED